MQFYIIILAILVIGGALYYYRKRKKTIDLKRKQTPLKLAKSATTLSSCIEALQKVSYMDCFADNITQNLEQVQRFNNKLDTIKEILAQRFDTGEMSFKKFISVLQGVEQVVYTNMRIILNKISAFDYEEYKQLSKLEWNSDELAQEKMSIYQKYIDFVQEATNDNEEILLKLDRLLLEISQYNAMEDIMNMPAMIELDKLIKNAKLYR
jgi:hypothetical protein